MTALVKYDAMCQAIAEAYTVDEVKEIRNKAVAIEAYAKQANNTEAELHACEIRLRAERKVGKLRKKELKAKGGRPKKNSGPSGGRVSTNAERQKELKISRKQDKQWQQLAGVPEEEFEAALAGDTKPSTSGIIGKPSKPMPDTSLWLWGRLRDFERQGLLEMTASEATELMTPPMVADVKRLAPLVGAWLKELADDIG